MVSLVQVSPLIKLGVPPHTYRAMGYSYLKPRTEEERKRAAEEKRKQDEQKWNKRELAEWDQSIFFFLTG
uniref:ATP synthase subunit e, mitochondrial n=1 Tax=Neovison vison TaxID=452646 RepID=A0A8C7A2Y7_NEOVI